MAEEEKVNHYESLAHKMPNDTATIHKILSTIANFDVITKPIVD